MVDFIAEIALCIAFGIVLVVVPGFLGYLAFSKNPPKPSVRRHDVSSDAGEHAGH